MLLLFSCCYVPLLCIVRTYLSIWLTAPPREWIISIIWGLPVHCTVNGISLYLLYLKKQIVIFSTQNCSYVSLAGSTECAVKSLLKTSSIQDNRCLAQKFTILPGHAFWLIWSGWDPFFVFPIALTASSTVMIKWQCWHVEKKKNRCMLFLAELSKPPRHINMGRLGLQCLIPRYIIIKKSISKVSQNGLRGF